MKEKNQTNKSKWLSYVLRHKPESAGIVLDKNGWATVAGIINNDKESITLEELQEIVKNDSKGRYVFSECGLKIRAVQGHSIQVDLNLKEKVPPTILWHGTSTRFWEAIKKEGLKPQNRQYVHLSADVEVAQEVGKRHGGELLLLQVDCGKLLKEKWKFFQAENGVWLTQSVPSTALKKIELVEKGSTSEPKYNNKRTRN